MDIASKYCKFFMSDNMTRLKYDELYRLAVSINEEKNRISELVCKDLFKYLNTKPFDFVTEMHARFKGVISSSFDTQMYRQVIDMYENKFKALQKKLTFEHIECGHKHNADINASINIRNRVSVAVLRTKLLKQLDNGAYKPIPMSRDKVKDALLSYRSSELQGLPKI